MKEVGGERNFASGPAATQEEEEEEGGEGEAEEICFSSKTKWQGISKVVWP